MGWERSKDWDQLCSHAETRGGSSRAFQGRWRWLPVELGGSLVRPHGHERNLESVQTVSHVTS